MKIAHRADPAATAVISMVLVPFQRHPRPRGWAWVWERPRGDSASRAPRTVAPARAMRSSAARARASSYPSGHSTSNSSSSSIANAKCGASGGHRRETPPGILDRGNHHACLYRHTVTDGIRRPKLSQRLNCRDGFRRERPLIGRTPHASRERDGGEWIPLAPCRRGRRTRRRGHTRFPATQDTRQRSAAMRKPSCRVGKGTAPARIYATLRGHV